ncbi:hypothetical protein CCR75_005746 [Bremia lactucae]|uniref:Uncharacterized protein n=1 Tax=Bremia lactucae TaxID=4779 RepID=A0A976FRN0_BRELC|nr:hypothetical protein CCR75_005746 [Bremia lactucae]
MLFPREVLFLLETGLSRSTLFADLMFTGTGRDRVLYMRLDFNGNKVSFDEKHRARFDGTLSTGCEVLQAATLIVT